MWYVICAAATGIAVGIMVMAFGIIIDLRKSARLHEARTAKSDPPEKKRKLEFSKILAIWAAIIGTAALVAPFVLSAHDKQPVEGLSISVFTACIGYLVTYAGKSAFEKNSRNKYRLDEYGNPFNENIGGSDDEFHSDP